MMEVSPRSKLIMAASDPRLVMVSRSKFQDLILSGSSSADPREASLLAGKIFQKKEQEADSSLKREEIDTLLDQQADIFRTFDWGRDFGIDNQQRVKEVTNQLTSQFLVKDELTRSNDTEDLMRIAMLRCRSAVVYLTDRYVRRCREQAFLKLELQLVRQCFPAHCIVIAMMETRIRRKCTDFLLELGFAQEDVDELRLVDLSDVQASAAVHAANLFQHGLQPILNVPIAQMKKKIEIYSKQVLFESVAQGNVALVEEILAKGFCHVNDQDEAGRRLLHLSVLHRQPAMMVHLLQQGADVNAVDVDKSTVLHLCCRLQDVELLQELLRQPQVKLNATNAEGYTPLHIASKVGNAVIIELLAKRKAELRLPDINGDTAIDLAATEEIRDMLLALDSNQKSLLRSIQNNDMALFAELLNQPDVDVNICNEDGRSCLYFAATQQSDAMVKQLLARGADPNLVDNWGDSPLASAVFYDSGIQIIEMLLQANGNVRQKNSWGNSPVFNACQAGNVVCVEMMIQRYDADVNEIGVSAYSNTTRSLVEVALYRRFDTLTSMLLSAGAKVDKSVLEEILALRGAVDISYEAIAAHQFQLWFTMVQLEHNEHCQALIAKFIQSHPHLLHAKDHSGRIANAVASEGNKAIMNSFFLWHGRYRALRAEHNSATSYVFRGVDEQICDDQGNYLPVAIKLMRFKTHFLRELLTRQQYSFDAEYLVPIMASFPSAENIDAAPEEVGDASFGLDSKLSKVDAEKLFCIVMPLADRNMFVSLKQERFAGHNMEMVKDIFRQLVHCAKHLHDHKVLHADIKPLNIMRIGATWKLIDLDAACRMNADYIGLKYSSGYLPPEAIFADLSNAEAFVKSADTLKSGDKQHQFELVVAHPSYDIWSLGCVLYQLCSRDAMPLFVVGQDDNLTSDVSREDNLFALQEWTASTKQRKLSFVTDVLARNLLSLMLMKDPQQRPSIAQVLSHPFLSGKKVVRLPHTAAKFDIFLSYRVASDITIVEKLYEVLTSMGFRVWWDKKCLALGVDWKEGFCAGLITSRTYLCVVSREGINHPTNPRQSFAMLEEDSDCDNLLLEIRLAVELQQLGYLERVVPLLAGDSVEDGDTALFLPFQRDQCIPKVKSCVVRKVEESLQEHLDRQALGSSVFPAESPAVTVAGLLNHLLSSQGIMLQGEKGHALLGASNQIASMLSQLETVADEAVAVDASQSRADSSRSHLRVIQRLQAADLPQQS